MADREKVIKGLFEMAVRDTWKDIDPDRERFQPILNDANELLKEQQPRVLGYEELFKKETFCVWYEEWGDPTIRQVACIDGEYEDMNVHYAIEDSEENRAEYGIVWRMWTGEPTDKQRKAVPWD